jgi:predicted nuclease of predicted toxin-antitoxin system
MKLLFDANISRRLAANVDYIGLPIPAKDKEIWEYALKNSLIIVTNDNDFLNLVNIKDFRQKLFC